MAKRKVSAPLSKHETDVLLGLYSGCECLWNTKCAEYSEERVRIGAFRTIINGMRLETGKEHTLEQVQGVLDCIMKTYTQELEQVLSGQGGSEGGYKSQWRWFHFLDSFLRKHALQQQVKVVETEDQSKSTLSHSKQLEGDESADTDDYDCTISDCGQGEASPTAPSISERAQSPTVHSPEDSHPVRTTRHAGLRSGTDSGALVNGLSSSGHRPAAMRHSSRKRQRVARDALMGSRNLELDSANRIHLIDTTRKNNPTSARSSSSPCPLSSDLAGSAGDGPGSAHACNNLHISSQIADTLKAVQTLLATSLTDQDQPTMVFARHIANELQQIENYSQRKRCMLDIQQVILRYQTRQHQAVPASVKSEESRAPVDGEDGRGDGSVEGSGRDSQPSCSEESLLIYFDTS